MGTKVQQIVNINITRQTQGVAQASFSIPCHLACHAFFTERARVYTSIDAVAGDIPTDSPVYAAAQKLFSQELVPTQIVIGRRLAQSARLSVTNALPSTKYVVVVNGTTVNYTSGATGVTAASVATGIKTAISAVVPTLAGFSITDDLSGNLTFNVTDTNLFTIKDDANTSLTFTPSTETFADAITAVVNANNSWYGLTVDSHVVADQLAIAAQIESMKKMYATSTQDATAKSSSTTTDIGSQLKALGYTRTFVIWHDQADSQYPECAFMGLVLQYVPGSYTAKFKHFAGISTTALSDSDVTNLKAKNYNVYELVGGVNMLSEGIVAMGEFFDTMVLCDWTDSRMRERIFFRLANMLKMPYTRAGFALIEAEMRAVFAEGVANGGFTTDVQPVFTIPDPQGIDPNTRAKRIADGFKFVFTLAGAVHFVKIAGSITV